jgi:hypothetical protein
VPPSLFLPIAASHIILQARPPLSSLLLPCHLPTRLAA